MKLFFLSTYLILFFISYVECYTQSMGQSGILGKIQAAIEYFEDEGDEVVRIEADIIHSSKETVRVLDPSFTYNIVAVGSNSIKDIDIELYEKVSNSWKLIAKDNDEKDIAIVKIKPLDYKEYKVVVKVYKFFESFSVGHYGLIFAHN